MTHVLVTGAGRDTGRKLALAFAARGAHVFAVDQPRDCFIRAFYFEQLAPRP